MRITGKWAAGIGVLAVVGAALWMREIASWRPVVVAKMPFAATQLRLSRDGKQLWVEESHTRKGVVVGLENGTVNLTRQGLASFESRHGLEIFPPRWLR